MRVALLSASISRRAGGLFTSARRLAQGLAARSDTEVEVVACRDPEAAEDSLAWLPLAPSLHEVRGPRGFGYAPGLARALLAGGADLVHVQHLWMYPSIACTRWHRATGRPFMVSPRGMLDPVALGTSRLKKVLAAAAYESRHLRLARCVHALSEHELRAVRDFGYEGPVCVVPNGVDLPVSGAAQRPAPWADRVDAGAEVLLFLGRIHPKKGLDVLVTALERIARDGPAALDPWHLVIAGWGALTHVRALEQRLAASPLAPRAHFVGALYDEAKTAALSHASAFALTSRSEGMPMSVLEAGAHALPLLITPECGLERFAARGGALEVGSTPDAVERGLRALFAMRAEERRAMGVRAREEIEEHHHWPRIVARMHAAYAWMLGAAQRPDWVDA